MDAAPGPRIGTSAAEHLSPAFPERAAWGTVSKLRAWQEEAIESYFTTEPRDFLAAATPGAGKTTFALRLAAELLARRTVDRITVVAPTEHLKKQWADAAHRAGIRLDPTFTNAARTVRPALPRRRGHLRPGRRPRLAAPRHHRVVEDPRHPRRGPPRRRRAELGRRHPRGLRIGHPPPVAHRHAVPVRHRADSRS